MSFNTFGHLWRVTTWGESHGRAIGCVVDGTPPNIPLEEKDMLPWMEERLPGRSQWTTQRKEDDRVQILSGVFPDEQGRSVTTGTPISLMILNQDVRSKDYADNRSLFRPSHADYVYQEKYGIRDWRGGGRASARETAMRVAAGVVARKIVSQVTFVGGVMALGGLDAEVSKPDWKEARKNPFWCPQKSLLPDFEKHLAKLKKEKTSCGALIEVRARGIPVGWGAPVYGKLDADLAQAMMSINAVKSVAIGSGEKAAEGLGHTQVDRMTKGQNVAPEFSSNNAGGIVGGISTGQEIVVRVAFKPTSSIPQNFATIDTQGEEQTIRTIGRHDPCVGLRAVPIVEAMMACVFADHFLRNRGQSG